MDRNDKIIKNFNEAISCFNRMEALYKIKCKELEIAKSKAIKEFAERLKVAYDYNDFGKNTVEISALFKTIDKLAKEVAEVEE